jgi:uncharacterized membrane protein YcgQ (UPF0703/DUF1980 family)
MKCSSIVKTALIVSIGVAVLVSLRYIPHDGFQGPRIGDDLLKTINRDRPAAVGNEDAEALLRNVERNPAVPDTGTITLSDEAFSPGYDEIYDNREKYYGRELTVSGYVETDNLPSGQFLIGRDLVWCCQQDKYFIGFLVLIDGAPPVAGAELLVTGTLEPVSYSDPETGKTFDVPAIRAKKLERAPRFSREVYPFSR